MKEKTVKFPILRIAILVVLAALFVAIVIYAILYVPRISTMNSIYKVSDFEKYNVYYMDYKADYKLDEILEAGAGTTAEFTKLSLDTLLPGIPIKIDPVEIACSACITKNSNGEYMMGRNFDLDDSSCVVVHTYPQNGYESIGFSALSYLGLTEADDAAGRVASLLLPYTTMDGINEKGFACCMLWLDDAPTVQSTGKTPITTTVAQRLLLDRAANVEEGIELLSSYDMRSVSGGDYHFYLTDAEGNSAIVEWPEPSNEMVVIRDVETVTNFFICDVPDGVNVGHGQNRRKAMDDMLDGLGHVADVETTFEVLKSAQQTVKTEVSGVTQWSSVYQLNELRANLVFQRHWDKVFSFDFE